MDTQHDRLVGEASAAYRQIGVSLRCMTHTNWIRLDLTMLQIKSIILLAGRDSMTLGELAATLAVSRQVGSSHLDDLIRRGLIDRVCDPGDRRRYRICLTHAAQPLIDQLYAIDPAHLQRWLDHMDATDLAALHRGLAALTSALAQASP